MTGPELKSIRLALGMTAAALARLMGVSGARVVYGWEASESVPQYIALIAKLLCVSKVSPDQVDDAFDRWKKRRFLP